MDGLAASSSFSTLKTTSMTVLTQTSIVAQSTSSAHSQADISAEGRLKNLLTGNSRFELSQTTINVTVASSGGNLPNPLDDPAVDMILRLLAKNQKDYQRMKSSLGALSSQANQWSSQSSQGASQARVTSYQISLEVTQGEVNVQNVQSGPTDQSDPLVLDLSGTGIELTQAGQGANFDINADGKTDSTAWVKGGSAFLALDKNNNGRIDNGSELFGDQNGAANGFAELKRYDANNDNVIDAKDAVYSALKAYRNASGSGSDLASLEQVGVKSISLSFSSTDQDVQGNKLILRGSFTTNDGEKRDIADALLGYRTAA